MDQSVRIYSRPTNEILRKALAYFAQAELDYPQGTSAQPGVKRRQAWQNHQDHDQRCRRGLSAGSRQSAIQRRAAECLVGSGFHLGQNMARRCRRRFRDRCVCPLSRRLEGIVIGSYRLCLGCTGTGVT